MDRNKKPHPEQALINKIIKVGGQLLPGMVPFSSDPESDRRSEDEEEEEEEEELTVQVMQAGKFFFFSQIHSNCIHLHWLI